MEREEIEKKIESIKKSSRITDFDLFTGNNEDDWVYYFHIDGFFDGFRFNLYLRKWKNEPEGTIDLWVENDKEKEFNDCFELKIKKINL